MLKHKYKRMLRILLYSVLSGLILYSLLPWILPMGLVKRKLTAQLEHDFGRPVRIGEITVRWGEGVQIRDMVIQRKRKYGAGELLRVGRLHTSFSPLRMLCSGLDTVLMEDVDFYVVATEEDLNIIDMPPLEVSQLVVDNATVHFETHLEGQISKVIFEAGSTVIAKDKRTDAFAWEVSARQLGQNEPTIVSRGQIGRFANPSREPTEPEIQVSLRNLDLSMLGIDRWINLGLTGGEGSASVVHELVDTLQGKCSGEVHLQLSESQEMSGEGWFALTDLEVTGRKGEDAAQLWGAMDRVSGRFWVSQYDPVTNWVQVGPWEIECPGLAFKGECQYDPREGAESFLSLKVGEGRVEPTVLAQTIPVLSSDSFSGEFGEGWVRFEAEYQSGERAESGRLVLDGTSWEFEIGDISKPADELLRLELSGQMNHDQDELCLSVDTLQWASLRGQGNLTVHHWYQGTSARKTSGVEPRLQSILAMLTQGSLPSRLQADISIGEMSEFGGYVADGLGSTTDLALSGAVQAEISAQGDKGGQEFSVQMQLPASARCVWSDTNRVVWQKETGKEFRLECSGRWQAEESLIEDAHLHSTLGVGEISFGPGRLVFGEDVLPFGETTDRTGHLKSPLLAQANGTWHVKEVSDWLIALPELQHKLAKQGIDLQGSCAGDIGYRHDIDQALAWSGHVDFTDFQIRAYSEEAKPAGKSPAEGGSLLFEKPAGEIGTVSVSATENCPDHTIEYHVEGQVGSMAYRGDGQAVRLVSAEANGGPIRHRHWDIEGEIKAIEDVPRYFVGLFDEKGWYEEGDYRLGDMRGGIHLTGQWHIGELIQSFQIAFDGSKSCFVLAEAGDSNEKHILWNKRPGSPFTMDGELTITEKDGLIGALIGKPGKRSPSRLAKIKTLHLETAGLSLDGTGEVNYEKPADSGTDWIKTTLHVAGELDHGGTLGQEIPLLGELQRDAGLHGSTHLEFSLERQQAPKRLQCNGMVDFTQSASSFRWSIDPNRPDPIQITKPIGDSLRCSFSFGVREESDVLDLDNVQLQFGQNMVSLSGQLRGMRWSDWPLFEGQPGPFHKPFSLDSLPAKEADWHLHVAAPELEELAKWIRPLDEIEFAGHLKADVNLFQQYEPTTATYWKPSMLTGALYWNLDRWPMEFQIREMELSSARLLVPEATLRAGENHLTLVTDVAEPIISWEGLVHEFQQPKGRIDVLSGKLDLDDIQEIVNAWQKKPLSTQIVSGTQTTREVATAFRYEDISEFLSKLHRCNLTGRCEFDNLNFTDPANSVRMDMDKMLGRYEVTDGIFQVQFIAGLGGGVVEGTIRCDLDQATPVLEYSQTARQLQANEMLGGIVESEFPGLEVTGTISEKKKMTGDLYQILATSQGWQGEGVTQCSQGVLFGPGGPGWMLRVFPGLKLVEYDWREFTNEYDLSSDGTKKNKMLFKGSTYNIYINGVSKPIQETDQYQAMIRALETDLQANREELKALESGKLELRESKAQRLRIQTAGLEQLWQKHQAGQTLRAFQADYNVGGLVSTGGGKKFKTPTEILRIPIFRTQSYIVERYMVGIQTSNIIPSPL